MEEAKFNNLCSHYKDTFDIHRASIKQRDTLFYGLLVILAIFTLQLSSTEMVVGVVNDYVNKATGIKIGKSADFVSTLLWLLLLGFTTRYYQVVLEIERQYGYLHILEKKLNSYYPETKVFTREGKSYLSKYPLFSNWVWFLYTIFFPSLIIFSVIMRGNSEIREMQSIEVNQIIDFVCYLVIATSSILYIYRLHESSIQNITNRCTGLITRWRS
ncbi:hypothetical protein [thiotrophic endosymbiont of Bathymodiolus puteoserpentis (Logatchev)]|uniref:hypothetical protein n=1 Tax=thiotrophic endosymbiont of Bathymodiolus puteoserpentis (Logatchev) TaxID=343240 RepID=UPI0010B8CDF0|nr:hypothetical protein [thiotrophic endosymbiont of Bathymodiolus puteoserpentis (Logatchev)]CAC9639832.1 hypothetical protein [uncultured Gammaproteobacteria bacterium]SSC10710.1 hypothetical protein BPUTEOSOX_1498 [thiotrophic endosymbiont of Bathymodiolus puteoserpentis (Logatchev)]